MDICARDGMEAQEGNGHDEKAVLRKYATQGSLNLKRDKM